MATSDSPRRRIGDYFTLQRGVTYQSALLGRPGPVLLGLASIHRHGGFRRAALQTYGGESPTNLLVRPGELFLSLKDVTQSAEVLGAVARLPLDHPAGRLTQDTVKLLPIGENVPSQYLYWLLRTPLYRSYCRAHATGTTTLALAREDFLAFPAPEPTAGTLEVVRALDALDDKIELNRRTNETLEAMARALFRAWFVDFEPVRAKQDGRPLDPLSQRHQHLFPDRLVDTEHGEIPEGWEWGVLGDFAEMNSWTLSVRDELDRVEYVEISEVMRGEVRHIPVYERGEEPSRARRRLRHGDTVLSTVRPDRGAYFLCLRPSPRMVASTGFAVLSPRGPWGFVHAAATQKDVFETLGLLADGGAYPAVSPEVVCALPVCVPEEGGGILDAFHAVAGPMFEKANANRAENRQLADMRDALLPRLLSGGMDVTA